MKILSCHIDAFGKFKDVDFNFDQMNVIYQKNGFGKTTLAQFLKAMFYSLAPSSKKVAVKSERDLYKPFNFDGRFGGNLTFECEKGTFIIARSFGATVTMDRFLLLDAKTKLKSNVFSENVGEELFGVGRDTFENSIFFGQKNLPSGINDDIRANLSTGVLSGDDIDAYEKTQTKLQKRLKELRADLRSVNIEQSQAESLRVDGKIQTTQMRLQNCDEEISQIHASEKTERKYDKEKTIKFQNDAISLESVINSDLQRAEVLKEKLKSQERNISSEEYEFLKENKNVKNIQKFKLLAIIFTFFAIFSAILLISMIFYKNITILWISLALTVAFCGVSSCFWTIYIKNKEKLQKYRKIIEKNQIFDLQNALLLFEKYEAERNFVNDEYENVLKKIDENQQKLTAIKTEFFRIFGVNIDLFDEKIKFENDKLSSNERRLVELQTIKENLRAELDNLSDQRFKIQDDLTEKQQKIQEISKKIDILLKTSQFLENSKNVLSTRFIEPISKRFELYYRNFLPDGDNIILDANLAMKLSNFKDIDFLSAGLFDLVYVCKRLALVDLLFKKEKPPIILDDPFANFDDEKVEIAKKILTEMAKRFQIIEFTCQKGRM